MAKLATYLFLMIGFTILFYFTGLIGETDTPNATLITLLLHPNNIPNTVLTFAAENLLTLLASAGIIVGAVLSFRSEKILKATYTLFLLTLTWDFIAVFNVVNAINPIIAIVFFAPFLFVYIPTVLQWWDGVTT